MKRTLGLLAGFLALTAAPLWADTNSSSYVTGYLDTQAGIITGSVVSSDPLSVVVSADGGQQQTFAVDSKSVVPDEMTAGERIRVQFRLLDSGTYHAQRVTPIQTWEEDYAMPAQMHTEAGSSTTQTTAMETHEYQSTEPVSQNATETQTTQATTTTTTSSSDTYDNARDQTSRSETTTEQDRLPETASSWPLIALIASLALALSAVLWIRRRLGRV